VARLESGSSGGGSLYTSMGICSTKAHVLRPLETASFQLHPQLHSSSRSLIDMLVDTERLLRLPPLSTRCVGLEIVMGFPSMPSYPSVEELRFLFPANADSSVPSMLRESMATSDRTHSSEQFTLFSSMATSSRTLEDPAAKIYSEARRLKQHLHTHWTCPPPLQGRSIWEYILNAS
jgi:hypothetical protein